MNTKYYKKYLIKDGLVEYNEDGKKEIILIEKKILDDAIDSIKYKPVIITHDGEEQVGEVVDCYYDVVSGNYVVGFNIWNDKAKNLLDNNYSISSTFEILDKEEAKEKYHNILYDFKVKLLEFLNIAIVKIPRYNETSIYINSLDNEKENEGNKNSGNWGHKGRKGKIGGSSSYGSGNYSTEELSKIRNDKLKKGIESKNKSRLISNIKSQIKDKLFNNKELKEKLDNFKLEKIKIDKDNIEKKEEIKDKIERLENRQKVIDKEIDDSYKKSTETKEYKEFIENRNKLPDKDINTNYIENEIKEIEEKLIANGYYGKEVLDKWLNENWLNKSKYEDITKHNMTKEELEQKAKNLERKKEMYKKYIKVDDLKDKWHNTPEYKKYKELEEEKENNQEQLNMGYQLSYLNKNINKNETINREQLKKDWEKGVTALEARKKNLEEKLNKRVDKELKKNPNLSQEEQKKIRDMSNNEYKEYRRSKQTPEQRQAKIDKFKDRIEKKQNENAEYMRQLFKDEKFKNDISKQAIEGLEIFDNEVSGKRVFVPNSKFWKLYKDNKDALKEDFNIRKYEYNDYTKNNYDKSLYNLLKKKSLGWYVELKD